MKALVIQPAFLGDAVISLSLAEELRRLEPQCDIAYLVRPEVAPAIMLSPSVNKVFTYDRHTELLRLPHTIVAIAPDSFWETKQWGVHKYLLLANLFKSSNYSIVFIGSDESIGRSIAYNQLNSNQINLLAKTSIKEVI